MNDFEELDKIIKSIATKTQPTSSLFKVKLSSLYEEEKQLGHDKKIWDDLEITIEAVLGTKKIPLKDLYAISEGSIIPLNEAESEKICLYVNEKAIARGEIVALNGHFGVKITEIIE